MCRVFDTGSPYNVPAGHSADLSALKTHYQRKSTEAEEKRMAQMAAMERDRETEAQRKAAEEIRPMSISSVLERIGAKRPEK